MKIINKRNSTIQIEGIVIVPCGSVEMPDAEWKDQYNNSKIARELLAGGFIAIENDDKQNKKKEKK